MGNVEICFEGKPIEKVTSLRILGVIFDQYLSFKEHTLYVKKKCFLSLSRLYRIKKVLSKENKIALVNALVMSHIRYCAIIWLSNKSKRNLHETDQIIRSAARFILNKRKYDSVTKELCEDLEMFLAEYMCTYDTLCFAYKCTFMTTSSFFNNYLNFSFHETQRTRNSKYIEPLLPVRSFWGKCSFKYNAVDKWINLPENVYKKVGSIFVFKKAILSHLLKNQCDRFVLDSMNNSIDISECIDFVIEKNK